MPCVGPIAALVVTTLVAAVCVVSCAADRRDDRSAGTGSTASGSAGPSTGPSTSGRSRVTTSTLPDLGATDGLAASIRQFREDEVAGVLQIELVRSRDPGDPAPVRSVQLIWPGLAPQPPTLREVAVAPGQRVDVPTPLGEPVCDTTDAPSYASGAVVLTIARPGLDDRSLTVPLLADAQPALDNVWTKGCVRKRLLERVALRYDPWGRTDDGGVPAGRSTLVVTRRTAVGPVRVTGVDGSVLLVVRPADPLGSDGVELPVGTDEVRIPLLVTGSGRCDGHALGDSKRTYVFQVQVQLDDDEPVGVDVTVPEADRPLLNQVIVDTCGDDHLR